MSGASECKLLCEIALNDCPMDAQLWSNGASTKIVISSGKNVFLYEFYFHNGNFDEVQTPHATYTLPALVCTSAMNPLGNMLVCGCEDSLIYRLDASSEAVLGRLSIFSLSIIILHMQAGLNNFLSISRFTNQMIICYGAVISITFLRISIYDNQLSR